MLLTRVRHPYGARLEELHSVRAHRIDGCSFRKRQSMRTQATGTLLLCGPENAPCQTCCAVCRAAGADSWVPPRYPPLPSPSRQGAIKPAAGHYRKKRSLRLFILFTIIHETRVSSLPRGVVSLFVRIRRLCTAFCQVAQLHAASTCLRHLASLTR